jgi:CheY-like chemotaxis protein
MLKRVGYTVYTAKNGTEAIELYTENQAQIDLVMLDMIMPGLDGGETFDRLRKINPHIKVLLSSGFSLDGQASDIMKRGCNGFIQKPFDLRQLSSKVHEVLNQNGPVAPPDKGERALGTSG